MQALSSIAIGRMGIFFGVKTSKVDNFFVVRNLSLPASRSKAHPMQMTNPFKPMLIAVFRVCSILPVSGLTKVFKSVVGFVSIDVVNLIFWPLTSDIKPNKPMDRVALPTKFKVNIPFVMKAPSYLPNANFWSWFFPNQTSVNGIKIEKFCQLGMCNHVSILPGSEIEVNFNRGIKHV